MNKVYWWTKVNELDNFFNFEKWLEKQVYFKIEIDLALSGGATFIIKPHINYTKSLNSLNSVIRVNKACCFTLGSNKKYRSGSDWYFSSESRLGKHNKIIFTELSELEFIKLTE